MSLTLIIDTAFETAQLALVRDGKIIAHKNAQSGGAHDRVLAGMAAKLFSEEDITPYELTKIMVTTGPGRFTGLRVGIAFARGLSLVHKIPLIGVNTADAIGYDLRAKYKQEKLVVLIGVKRGQSFVRYVGKNDIHVVEDDQLAATLSVQKPLVVGGVLSEAAQAFFPLDGVTLEKGVTEPSLEAILAVSADQPGENTVVRPYYA